MMDKKIDELVKLQCSSGNWNFDPYMHGMANGMLLIQAILNNTDYKPLEAPKEWLYDKKSEGVPVECQ